jgi:hypothetical protein
MRRAVLRKLGVFLVLPTLWPTLVLAQQPKVGVVSALQGVATVARVPVPQEVPLRFKDDVLLGDRIATRESSIVRVLLGGKALVTVRELSVLSITAVPGRATVDVQTGKVGLAVASKRLRPGESIEIRTPNAVAAVRGTVVIVEVLQASAQLIPGAVAVVTNFYVLAGVLEAALHGVRDLVRVGAGQSLSFSGNVRGDVRGIAAGAVAGIVQGLKADPPHKDPPPEVGEAVGIQAQGQAGALMAALDPTGSSPPPVAADASAQPSTANVGVNETQATTTTAKGGAGAPPPVNLLVNGGFEAGPPPWGVLLGVVSFGPFIGIAPPEGLSLARVGGDGIAPESKLVQNYTPPATLFVTFKHKVLTNTMVITPGFDDSFLVGTLGPPLTFYYLKTLLVFGAAPGFVPSAALGFTFETAGGFITEVLGPFPASCAGVLCETVFFEVLEDEGAPTGTASAWLIDDVKVTADPPLMVVRDGARYVSTRPEPLFSFVGQTAEFDSLLLVCCQTGAEPSLVSLAGPLMHAKDSALSVPFALAMVLPGGRLTSSSTDSLVLLEGGNYSLGAAVGVFDLRGERTAVDAATGLTLGTDRPLEHRGALLESRGAAITTQTAVRADTALLEASAPLLNLTAGSSLTSASSLVQLDRRAGVTAAVPSDALVKLDASTLTVRDGSLFNVARGSSLSVTGTLLSLANGSTLNVLSGSLVNVSSGSIFNLMGGSLAAFGAGANALNLMSSASLCAGCSVTTGIANFGGYPVLLMNGATASNVSVAPGFTPFGGLGATNTVKVSGASGAVLTVDGATSKVVLGK